MKKRFLFSPLRFMIVSITLALPLALVSPLLHAGAAPMASAMPDLSPEQMEDLQRELAKINEEMQAFVKTLPEEKQQEIAELENAINQMSDEELEQLFEQLFTDENFLREIEQMYPEQEEQPEPVEPEPVIQPVIPVEKPIEKPKVAQNRIALAAEMIQSLSNSTSTFLAKLDAIPEIDDLVRNWIKKQQVRGWKQQILWQDIKAQIELFNQKLTKMLYKEPGSNEYRFLPDLVNDEALYNNLAHMDNVLKVNVPKIEISVFGYKKLSKEAKAVMRSVLNKYSEGMSELQVIPAINSIIEKHEPIAKQVREKEEALTKKALEDSKVARQDKPVVIAGKPEQRKTDFAPRYQDYYDDYYPSSGYQPSYSPSYSPSSDFDSSDEKPFGAPGAGVGAGKGVPGAKGKGEEEKAPDKKDEKGGKGKEKKGKEKKKSKADEQFDTVVKKFKEANKACATPQLINIRGAIHKRGTPPADLAPTIDEAVKKINAATSAVNDLGKALADQPDKTKRDFKNKVNSAYNKQAHAVGSVAWQFEQIENNWKNIKKSANKDYLRAYGFDPEAGDTKSTAGTSMDAEINEEETMGNNAANGNVGTPEDVMAQAQQAQAGLAQEEQAEIPAGIGQGAQPSAGQAPSAAPAAPKAPAQSPGSKASAPARDKELEDLLQERKAQRGPNTLQGAIEALKNAIDKLSPSKK